jgi:DNA-binding NarL/FixJ family response regulator
MYKSDSKARAGKALGREVPPARVLIGSSQPFLDIGIRQLLAQVTGLSLIGSRETVLGAIEQAAVSGPNVLILGAPSIDPTLKTALTALKEAVPEIFIIAISDESRRQATAGLVHFVADTADPSVLVSALQCRCQPVSISSTGVDHPLPGSTPYSVPRSANANGQ